MVNILRFPGSSKADNPSLAPADELQALFADDGTMVFTADSALPVLKLQAGACVNQTGDWTNQELANLYRVEALLVQAGIRLETDRGLTDEDDPWFVFCSPDGDVFVHLARLNGRYLLDSPGLGAPLYGDDFSALVDMFVRHQAATAPSGNVVRFRPGAGKDGVVRLHPAMMMAALIWTLYLASDQFVGTAEAAETASDLSPDAEFHTFSADVTLSASEKPSYLDQGQGRDDMSGRLHGPEMRTGPQTGGVAANSVAASLAAIAASWGLFDPRLGDLPELSELQQAAAQASITLDQLTATSGETVADHSSSNEHNSLNDGPLIKAEELTTQASEQAAHDGPRNFVLSGHDDTLLPEGVVISEGPHVADRKDVDGLDLAKLVADAVHVSSHQGAEKDAGPSDIQSLLKLAGLYTGEAQKYVLGNVKVTATFDITSLGKDATGLILSQLPFPSGFGNNPGLDGDPLVIPGAPPFPVGDTIGLIGNQPYVPSHLGSYDGDAKDFVYKFLRESSHVEMIKVDNSIIFVDTTAIDEATDIAMVKTWSLDDTTTVSTIGHADYFAQYFYLDYYLA